MFPYPVTEKIRSDGKAPGKIEVNAISDVSVIRLCIRYKQF